MNPLFSRNQKIISKTAQKKIARARIAFIGCGLGSNIAILAARTGFSNFILADGDIVEMSNLNRQEFFTEDLKKNKALVLKKKILSINKTAKISILNKFIEKQKDIKKIVSSSDIIINTADFSKGFFPILSEVAKKDKFAIAPFNVGLGSVVTVFNRTSINKLGKLPNFLSEKEGFLFLLLKVGRHYKIPAYFIKSFVSIGTKKMNYTPQVGIAANLTSALVVSCMIKRASNQKITYFPENFSIDIK